MRLYDKDLPAPQRVGVKRAIAKNAETGIIRQCKARRLKRLGSCGPSFLLEIGRKFYSRSGELFKGRFLSCAAKAQGLAAAGNFKLGKFAIRLAMAGCIAFLSFSINFDRLSFNENILHGFLPGFLSGGAEFQDGVGGGSVSEPLLMETLASLELGSEDFYFDSLSRPRALLFSTYSVRSGDMIGDLALQFGLTQDTILSVNGIRNSRLLQIGQPLKIPNQNGINITAGSGDTLHSIAERHGTDAFTLKIVNKLFSEDLRPGASIFIPGARLGAMDLQEINGDMFMWPTASRFITSPYGWRASPFTGRRQFHTGIDIRGGTGTPIWAAMDGRVTAAGWDNVFGNFVIITHHSGFRTLYGHMNVIRVRNGDFVRAGQRIGDVGSTGMSTGPHLHFTVFRNGVTVNPVSLTRR